jgi:cysteinyl-tRNA synthetase
LIQALPDQLASPDSNAIFEFQQLMDNDFNTPKAIALLFDLASEKSKESASSLLAIGRVLGLFMSDKATFLDEQQQLKAANSGLSDTDIHALITAREKARKDRDFSTADKIRIDLLAQGVVLEDAIDGTTWHRK